MRNNPELKQQVSVYGITGITCWADSFIFIILNFDFDQPSAPSTSTCTSSYLYAYGTWHMHRKEKDMMLFCWSCCEIGLKPSRATGLNRLSQIHLGDNRICPLSVMLPAQTDVDSHHQYALLIHSLTHEHTQSNVERHVLLIQKWIRDNDDG